MDERQRALHRLGATQHALVTRRQLSAHDWSRSQIDRAVHAGRLHLEYAGVYRIPGSPITSYQRILAAALASRAPASHRAATSVWGADLGPTPPLEVLADGSRHPRLPGVVVHRSRRLDPRDVTRRHGIPVTNPLRTLVDLGAVATPEQVELALDSFTSRRLITVAGARAYREKLAGSGQRGVGVLGEVLDGRVRFRRHPRTVRQHRAWCGRSDPTALRAVPSARAVATPGRRGANRAPTARRSLPRPPTPHPRILHKFDRHTRDGGSHRPRPRTPWPPGRRCPRTMPG